MNLWWCIQAKEGEEHRKSKASQHKSQAVAIAYSRKTKAALNHKSQAAGAAAVGKPVNKKENESKERGLAVAGKKLCVVRPVGK